jgi:hypothetical protein
MTTKTVKEVKKVVKKKATTVNKRVEKKNISLTPGQATKLQAALSKNGKSYKFLDEKITRLNA